MRGRAVWGRRGLAVQREQRADEAEAAEVELAAATEERLVVNMLDGACIRACAVRGCGLLEFGLAACLRQPMLEGVCIRACAVRGRGLLAVWCERTGCVGQELDHWWPGHEPRAWSTGAWTPAAGVALCK